MAIVAILVIAGIMLVLIGILVFVLRANISCNSNGSSLHYRRHCRRDGSRNRYQWYCSSIGSIVAVVVVIAVVVLVIIVSVLVVIAILVVVVISVIVVAIVIMIGVAIIDSNVIVIPIGTWYCAVRLLIWR